VQFEYAYVPQLSEAESVDHDLEICDHEVGAMKAECDKHYDVMEYCKEKTTL
jgi:hypothetical protein